jgi:xylulokinase
MKRLTLGFDLGTSAVKASLYDVDRGEVVAHATEPEVGELPLSAPHPGWAEQDPDDWVAAAGKAWARIRPVAQAQGEVIGIGIAYQMHGLVSLDENNQPLRPAIIWCDGRAVDAGRVLQGRIDPADRDRLANPIGNLTAAKLTWVAANEPETWVELAGFCLPGDYLALRLSGELTTTPTGWSEMVMWDYVAGQSANFVLHALGLDSNFAPITRPTLGVQARVAGELARAWELPEGIPISYRAGDQPNNAWAVGANEPGMAAASAGTSGVIYAVTDALPATISSRVNTFLHVTDELARPRLGRLMCLNGCGSAYRWLRDALGVESFEELNALAAQAPPGSGGVRFYPFGNGAERILDDNDLGARWHGIRFAIHGRAHMARSVMEGIAGAFAYGLELMETQPQTLRVGDNSLFRSELFTQILADTLGAAIDVVDTDGAAGAARGAAAGLGLPVIWPEVMRRVEPRSEAAAFYPAWRDRMPEAP